MLPLGDPVADDPRLLGGTPRGRGLEVAILDTPGCKFAEEDKGMPPKPAGLLHGEGHQAMLATDRGHGLPGTVPVLVVSYSYSSSDLPGLYRTVRAIAGRRRQPGRVR